MKVSAETHPLTYAIQPDGLPLDLAGYEAAGGYRALRKAGIAG